MGVSEVVEEGAPRPQCAISWDATSQVHAREKTRGESRVRARSRPRQVSLRTPESRASCLGLGRANGRGDVGAGARDARRGRNPGRVPCDVPRAVMKQTERDVHERATPPGSCRARSRVDGRDAMGTYQLARAFALALVLSEPVLGELLVALQAAQPLDRLGNVIANVSRRLHGRSREKHGHLDRRLMPSARKSVSGKTIKGDETPKGKSTLQGIISYMENLSGILGNNAEQWNNSTKSHDSSSHRHHQRPDH